MSSIRRLAPRATSTLESSTLGLADFSELVSFEDDAVGDIANSFELLELAKDQTFFPFKSALFWNLGRVQLRHHADEIPDRVIELVRFHCLQRKLILRDSQILSRQFGHHFFAPLNNPWPGDELAARQFVAEPCKSLRNVISRGLSVDPPLNQARQCRRREGSEKIINQGVARTVADSLRLQEWGDFPTVQVGKTV